MRVQRPVYRWIALVALLLLAFSVVACAAKTNPEADEPAKPSNPGGPGEAVNLTGDAANGKVIYEANCVSCHGEQGKGGGQIRHELLPPRHFMRVREGHRRQLLVPFQLPDARLRPRLVDALEQLPRRRFVHLRQRGKRQQEQHRKNEGSHHNLDASPR